MSGGNKERKEEGRKKERKRGQEKKIKGKK